MAACLEAKELNEMKEKAEAMANLVSAVVSFPFHLVSYIFNSYRLFMHIYLYFRVVSMERLTKCCKPGEQVCVDCLAKIYEFEQTMLKNSLQYTGYRFVGWGFKRIAEKIEDRSETLMLSINKDVNNAVNKFIDKIEKGGLSNSGWQEQLNAL